MSAPPFGFLTLPSPTDRSLERLRRKLALLVLRDLLTTPGPLSAWLQPVAQAHGPALLEIIARPEISTPLLAARSGQLSRDAALEMAVPHLLVALSEGGCVGADFVWSKPFRQLRSRRGVWEGEASAIWVSAAGVELRAPGPTPLLQLFCRSAHQRPIVLWDGNPLAHVEAHPDKDGSGWSLGGRSAREWADRFHEALRLIEVGLPSWFGELDVALRHIVPVGYEPERHLSASYREAPGVIYCTLHPEPLILAEAVVHEVQHGKLNTLSWLDPVLDNGQTEWTPSPVRPDLRPLMGVLLAAHAFIPVSALHAGLEAVSHPVVGTAAFHRRRSDVLRSNVRALETVEARGKPTALGTRVLADLRELLDAVGGREVDPGELRFA